MPKTICNLNLAIFWILFKIIEIVALKQLISKPNPARWNYTTPHLTEPIPTAPHHKNFWIQTTPNPASLHYTGHCPTKHDPILPHHTLKTLESMPNPNMPHLAPPDMTLPYRTMPRKLLNPCRTLTNLTQLHTASTYPTKHHLKNSWFQTVPFLTRHDRTEPNRALKTLDSKPSLTGPNLNQPHTTSPQISKNP